MPLCLNCESPVPAGAESCPGCDAALIWCPHADCDECWPRDAEIAFCPHCGREPELDFPLLPDEPDAASAKSLGEQSESDDLQPIEMEAPREPSPPTELPADPIEDPPLEPQSLSEDVIQNEPDPEPISTVDPVPEPTPVETEFFDPPCLECDTPIPDGTLDCPNCGTKQTICDNDDCLALYPAAQSFCPFCGAENPSGPAANSMDEGTESEAVIESEAGSEPMSSPNSAPAFSAEDLEGIDPALAEQLGSLSQEDAEALLLHMQSESGLGDATLIGSPDPVAEIGAAGVGLPSSIDTGSFGALLPTGNTAVPSDSLPILLELETGTPLKRGESGLLDVRVMALGLIEPTRVELAAGSTGWTGVARSSIKLSPGARRAFPAIPLTPQIGGRTEIRWTITLRDDRGVPTHRGEGRSILTIEVPEQIGDIHINQGESGFSYIDGDSLRGSGNNGPRAEIWEPVDLEPDADFPERRENFLRVDPLLDKTPDPLPSEHLWSPSRPMTGLIGLTDRTTGHSEAVAVTVGHAAAFGRGGDPSVAWWLRPDPYDERNHRRISRKHAVIDLRDGYAWLTDAGRNGVWLGDRRMPHVSPEFPGTDPPGPEPLAEGDRVSIANVVPLRCRLQSDGEQVRAVQLTRTDALRNRLSYLLTTNALPGKLSVTEGEPPIWVSFLAGGDGPPRLAVWNAEKKQWAACGHGKGRTLSDRFTVAWWHLPEPLDQTRLLAINS